MSQEPEAPARTCGSVNNASAKPTLELVLDPELTIREVSALCDAEDGGVSMADYSYSFLKDLWRRGLLRYGWTDGAGTMLKITKEGERQLHASPLYGAASD